MVEEKKDYTGIPEGYFRVGFLTPNINCCVEKVIIEMDGLLKKEGVWPIITLEKDPKSVIEYFPDLIVYFRVGSYTPVDINILAGTEVYIGYFHSMDIPIYYYMDDALFGVNNDAPLKLMKQCDELIFATNSIVDSAHKQIPNKTIHLLKTHMNFPLFDAVPEASNVMYNDKVNILYTSEGRIGILMLNRICEQMSKSPEKYKNVRLVCLTHEVAQVRSVINKWRGIDKLYYERVPLEEFYGISKMCQIILAPGESGDLDYFLPQESHELWLSAKSCVKYNVAGASSAVCIASANLKEYAMAIKHKETGFVAGDNVEEWMEYIDLMVENPELRETIGKKARRDVYMNWHIETRAKEFANILKGKSTCEVKYADVGDNKSESI